MKCSVGWSDLLITGVCCRVFQLDEHTRSLRDVISVVREVSRREKQRLSSSGGANGGHSGGSKSELYDEELAYPSIREAVIAQEQTLLRATGFDTHAVIPHKYLLNMAR